MSITLSRAAIDAMERRYRTNLVNALSGFKSANLLATVDAAGHANLAIVSSAFHVGAAPPLMGLLLRPHTVPRHSLENILQRGEYTLNHVDAALRERAHLTSARWPREVSEFDACGLTREASGAVVAPYVAESPVGIALRLVERHVLCNATELLVGEIVEVRLVRDARDTDGHLDLAALGTVAVSGLDEYHLTRSLGRLPYAKPDATADGSGAGRGDGAD